MRREVRAFGVLFVLGLFGRGLEMGRGVNVFGNLEYLGSEYEKEGMLMCLGIWGA